MPTTWRSGSQGRNVSRSPTATNPSGSSAPFRPRPRFVAGAWGEAEPETMLSTVLFTDIVGSTARATELGDQRWAELLSSHHAVIRRQLDRFRGRELDTAGDGFFASFDGPARAIRCACAIGDSVRDLGLELRAGLHTGECEIIGDKIGGVAVHIGAPCRRSRGARREAGSDLEQGPRESRAADAGLSACSLLRRKDSNGRRPPRSCTGSRPRLRSSSRGWAVTPARSRRPAGSPSSALRHGARRTSPARARYGRPKPSPGTRVR
jgi:hypothetical protein